MNFKTFSLFIFSFFLIQNITSQTQLGSTISGENDGDYFGRDVSLSDDGTIMAVGAIENDGGAENVGHVRVFKFSDGSWTQLGADIDTSGSSSSQGNINGDFGHSVSLSSDGTILAVGDRYFSSDNGINAGLIRVFQYSDNSWSQIGSDIIGLSANSNLGFDISLSSDGTIVASGDIGNNELSGTVRVFQYSNDTWNQLGENIQGVTYGERLGYSLDLSSDGSIIATASPYQDSKNGEVRVFKFSENSWTQLGQDINGEASGDEFGNKIQLSYDGTVLAIGAPYNAATFSDNINRAGHVRVYEFSNNSWSQKGSDIDAENSQDEFGRGIGLSSNGNVIAIGGTQYHDDGSGIVNVYTWTGTDWQKFGNSISAENTSSGATDFFGEEVSMSSNGTIVASGAKAGNYAKTYSLDIDQEGPTMTITAAELSDGDTSNDNTLSLTFTSNEDTFNFSIDDITISGGTLSNFLSTSSDVYTATFTPSGDGETTIDVAENTFTDAIGNANSAATQFNWTYDSTGPTMVISSNSSSSANTISTVAGGNGQGNALNQINYANGIFVDSSNNVYVADTDNHRIVKWEPGATEGVVVAGGNGQGDALNQLYEPQDIYIDSSGNIYISDKGNHRILKWEPSSSEGVIVAGGNGQGSALNQLYLPLGIDMDSSGNFYIADHGNDRIIKWDSGASEGTVVAGGNGGGDSLNQLKAPMSVAVDSNDNIYVVSSNNERVTKWSSGASEGVVYASGARFYDVFLDSNEDVYIADGENNRILKWAENASEGIVVAGDNGYGSNQDQLTEPMSIYVDSSSNLYILDKQNERVQKLNIDDNCTLSLTFTSSEPTSNFSVEDISVTCGTLSGFSSSSSTIYTATFTPNSSETSTFVVDGNTFTDAFGNINTVSNQFEWTCENNIPTATPQTISAIEQVEKTITLSGSDPRDGQLSFIVVSLPSNGVLTDNGSEIKSDELPKTINSSSVVYKATSETANEDSFNFKVTNGFKESTSSKVSINITLKSVITISSEKSEIFEHEKTKITASISSEHSEDIKIEIDFSGDATYEVDYTTDYISEKHSTIAGGTDSTSDLTGFNNTYGLFIDKNDNIYVSDRYNQRIVKWTPDAIKGLDTPLVVAGGNGYGGNLNQLSYPRDIFVDTNNNIYIATNNGLNILSTFGNVLLNLDILNFYSSNQI